MLINLSLNQIQEFFKDFERMHYKRQETLFYIISLIAELGELLHLFKDEREGDTKVSKKRKAEELSDVLIYLFRIANSLDIRLDVALEKKLEKLKKRVARNESRTKS